MMRCCCVVVVSLGVSFMSFVLGLMVISIGSLLASNSVTVPAVCRIVSSSVDIKSSRVCEFGFLKYNVRHVFHPKDKATFRCRDDYYWASIFEVEFKEYFSGQTVHAVAEAPKEALPRDCRPSFDTAWMTKMKFKVNETYSCRYILGSQKADIYTENLFKCQAKAISTSEMIRRLFMLLIRWHSEKNNASGCQLCYAVAGIILGMLSCMCCIVLAKILRAAASSLAKRWHWKKHLQPIYALKLRRACAFVAYFSVVGWALLQYRKIIGLKQLDFNSDLREQIM